MKLYQKPSLEEAVIVESSQIVQATNFSLIQPWWLFPITFQSSISLEIVSMGICPIIFPGKEVKLTSV